jgi:hypothetical protein
MLLDDEKIQIFENKKQKQKTREINNKFQK